MELAPNEGLDKPAPQWLGSLARKGEQPEVAPGASDFTAPGTQWLGSVARRGDAPAAPDVPPTVGWTGSSIRSAVFAAPTPAPDAPATDAPANVHALTGEENVVVGALGMPLRVAA